MKKIKTITDKIRRVQYNKKPKTKRKHIGIEIEFISGASKEKICKLIAENDLEESVTYHYDGSIDGEVECSGDCCSGEDYCFENGCDCECSCSCDSGHELCLIAPKHKIDKLVEKVCAILKSINAEVNDTCGLHVHLDARYQNKQLMFTNLVNNVDFFRALNPSGRRNNSFCMRNNLTDILTHVNTAGRYYVVNPHSIKRNNTIEVRVHSGTINADKIKNWIKLLSFIAYKPEPIKIDKFKDIKMNIELVNFYKERYKKFKKNDNPWVDTEVA